MKLVPNYDDFLKSCPICRGLSNNRDARELFGLLSKEDSIFAMIESIDQGRPALEGCARELEEWFNAEPFRDIDLCNDDYIKRTVGRMVRVILAPFGYEVISRSKIANDIRFFKTASCYEKRKPPLLKAFRGIIEA